VSAARQKLVAAASAIGLGLCIAAQAPGAPLLAQAGDGQGRQGEVRAKQRGDARQTRRALQVLEKPSDHFDKSLEVARRAAQRAAERAQASEATASEGSFPTPESVGVSTATLEAIASCESGGDPTAVSADGAYHGKYQFDYGTWASVGGSGDPAAATETEQDYRAALLYSQAASSSWPVCAS